MLTKLEKAMAPIYARRIHSGKMTLDEVIPQTEEYRQYVSYVYYDLFREEL